MPDRPVTERSAPVDRDASVLAAWSSIREDAFRGNITVAGVAERAGLSIATARDAIDRFGLAVDQEEQDAPPQPSVDLDEWVP